VGVPPLLGAEREGFIPECARNLVLKIGHDPITDVDDSTDSPVDI
jgi:hypothetical protein